MKYLNIIFILFILVVFALLGCSNQGLEQDTLPDGYEECISEKYDKYGETAYAPGRIMVSFVDGTTGDDAESLIKDYDLEFESIGNIFDVNPWGTVKVPDGEAIEWVCILREDDKIKNTNLDTLDSIN